MIEHVFSLIVVFALVIPTIYAFYIGAPILLVPKSSIRRAMKACDAKKNQKFYDLGCGTGRTILIAAKEFSLKPVGFELSPIMFLITKINLFLTGTVASVRLKNVYNADLADADIVFCFLTPKAMQKLAPKFANELKSGTKIISYCFSLPDWQPIKIIDTNNPGKVFIYEKK